MSRDIRLDVLRGVAIVLVLFRHREISEVMHRVGWVGVDLFFVLSGYLVSGLLFTEYRTRQEIDLRRFLLRRGFKIWPSFYFLILVSFILRDVFPWEGYKAFLVEVVFLQNYLPHLWGPTWSLAVEEHFYVLLAILVGVMVGIKSNLKLLGSALLVIMIGTLALRILNFRYNSFVTWNSHLTPTHFRIDSLCFGVLLSYIRQFYYDSLLKFYDQYRNLLAIVAFSLLSPFFFIDNKDPFTVTFGFTMLYISFGVILLLTIEGYFSTGMLVSGPGNFAGGILSAIGRSSYNIYLWHVPVNDWVMKPLDSRYQIDSILAFVLYVLISFSVGSVLTWTIETYFLRLRERFSFSVRNTFSN